MAEKLTPPEKTNLRKVWVSLEKKSMTAKRSLELNVIEKKAESLARKLIRQTTDSDAESMDDEENQAIDLGASYSIPQLDGGKRGYEIMLECLLYVENMTFPEVKHTLSDAWNWLTSQHGYPVDVTSRTRLLKYFQHCTRENATLLPSFMSTSTKPNHGSGEAQKWLTHECKRCRSQYHKSTACFLNQHVETGDKDSVSEFSPILMGVVNGVERYCCNASNCDWGPICCNTTVPNSHGSYGFGFMELMTHWSNEHNQKSKSETVRQRKKHKRELHGVEDGDWQRTESMSTKRIEFLSEIQRLGSHWCSVNQRKDLLGAFSAADLIIIGTIVEEYCRSEAAAISKRLNLN